MKKETLISMHNMGVGRNDDWLVRGVDFSICRGEIVTLIGPNGSGKSTTAKVATGVLAHTEGEVKRKAGLKIAHVPQRLKIDWTLPLSVERLMVLTESHSKESVAAELESVGAAHLGKAAVQHLSGGEFQRVLLARAMIRKPDLLVLDEPVQGVDFSGQATLYKLINTVRERTQCGVLLISHDLHVVMAGTDKVICLNGHVCCSGSPEMVAQSAEYRELFGEGLAGSLAIYHHHHDHKHMEDGSVQPIDGGHNHAG